MKSALPLSMHALINIAIISTILVTVWLTNNPLAILGLSFLQHMPVFPPEHLVADQENDENNPIGFVT